MNKKKYSILIQSVLIFIVVFCLDYFLFEKTNFSYIVKSIIAFISIFIVLYFTKYLYKD